MNIYTENNNMSPFDPTVEHILNLISVGLRIDIKHMLAAYQILDYKSFKQLDEKQLQNMTRNVNGTPTKLSVVRVIIVIHYIDYIRFHEANRDYKLATDPTSWNKTEFMNWIHLKKPKSIATYTPEQKRLNDSWKESARKRDLSANTVAVPTTSPESVSNEEVVIAREIRTDLNDVEIVSNKVIDSKDNSNLIGVADAPNIPNDGKILSLPLVSPVYRVEQPGPVCRVEQSGKVKDDVFHDSPKAIADFPAHPGFWDDVNESDEDDVENTVIVGDNKYGVVCDRSDDANPLPLPPESSPYNIIMPCNHPTNITNDDLVYRVEQSDEMNILIDENVNTLIEKVNSEYQFWPTNVPYIFDNKDQKSSYDDNYGVISKHNDVDHIPACSHREEDRKYPIRKLDDDDILNAESGTSVGRDYGDTYNGPGPNQANYIMSTNGESKSNILLRSSVTLDATATTTTAPVICMDSASTEDVSSNLSVVAAADDLFEEVNEEYPFWLPHRLVSNEEVTLNEIRTEIVSNENVVISNLNVAAAAATDDDDDIHSRDEEYPDEEEHHEELIGVFDGTRQDILNVGVLDGNRQVILNVESNNYDDKRKERILLPSSVSRLVKDDAVMINDEPVVESVEGTNETVVDSVEDPTARDSLKNHAVSDPKKGSIQYRPQLKKEQKKKEGEWVNNKKVKWSVDTKPPSLPTHLLPSPKLDTRSERIPSAITAEIKAYLERAQDETTNSNGDDICDLNNNTVQVEDVPDDNIDDDADYGEHNNFNYVDIGKEILQFNHEDLTGESETIVFYDCYDMDATQQEVEKYSIKKLYDDSILNTKLQVEFENSTGDLNGIQRDYPIVNEVISERDEANPPPLPPESNNHNQDLENCDNDDHRVHSELIDSNPSMIPNDGEIVVLLSSVSRVEKNVMVKNKVMSGSFSRVEMVKTKVMSGRLFQSVYRVNSNINLNKILQIVLSIFLQLGCEWTLKKYQVDNDPKMDWILKWYRVDNDDELEWLMKRYTVDNDDDSCNNEPASRYDSRIRGIPTVAVAAELNADEFDDLVYHDSNNDRDNEDNGDTFHNNAIDYGEQRLTLYIFNYAVSAKSDIRVPTQISPLQLRFRVDEPDYSNVHAPREGHLENVQRIYGYLHRFRHSKLRFRVDEPDYSNVSPIQDHDWDNHAATQVEDVSEDIYDDDNYVLRKQINSNSDDGNENDDDTFHDAIQVEDVMDDTDEESGAIQSTTDTRPAKEPVFKQFEFILRDDYGEPRLEHEGKKISVIGPSPNDVVARVFLTKPDERGNMKRAQVVELIDKFDDTLDKDPLRCSMVKNGCQVLLFRSTHRIMRSNDIQFSHGSTYGDVYFDGCNNLPDLLCSNQDPLKRAHSPRAHSSQGTLSLIDPIGCCVMKRKDGECPDPERYLYHRGAYRLYLEQPAGKMEYVWGDDESMINSPTVPEDRTSKRNNILSFHYVKSMLSWRYITMQLIVPKCIFPDILTKHWSYQSSYHELIHPVFQHAGNTAAMFPDETLEVDASIEKGTIFGILGSEKRSEKPMNRIHVCGQAIVETSMYTTVRRLLLEQ